MLTRRHWLSLVGIKTAIIGSVIARSPFRASGATPLQPPLQPQAVPGNLKPVGPADFDMANELMRVDPVAPISTGAFPAHWDNNQAAKCGHGPCGIAKEFGESGPMVGAPPVQVKEFLDDDDDGAESRAWITQLYNEFGDQHLAKTEFYELGVGIGSAPILPDTPTRFLGYGLWKDGAVKPTTPGPKFLARLGHPMVIRYINTTNDYMSVHLHGGHGPSHSDGHPAFVIPKMMPEDKLGSKGYGQNHRDYFYPHTIPAQMPPGAELKDRLKYLDISESPSTLWYHDHSMDITGPHVYMGLAGFMPFFDDFELDLLARGVLPMCKRKSTSDSLDDTFENCKTNPLDHTIVFQDRLFSTENQLLYSVKGHNGMLGDRVLVNGQWKPKMTVAPRQYRLRLLNGSNARIYKLELFAQLVDAVTGQPTSDPVPLRKKMPDGSAWHRLGKDSWLFPHAIRQDKVLLSMAARADMVIDFQQIQRAFAAELNGKRLVVYLANVLSQTSGRGPDGKLDDGNAQELPVIELIQNVNVANEREDQAKGELKQPCMLLKFEITEDFAKLPKVLDPQTNSLVHAFERLGYTSINEIPQATIRAGTKLRPHTPILPSEIVRTREVVFERGNGIWQINGKVVNEFMSNFVPELNSAECWILENGGGGWWHPIHIHLESHQQIEYLNEADVVEFQRILGELVSRFDQAVQDEVVVGQGEASAELKSILQAIKDSLAPFEDRLQGAALARGTNDDVSLQKLTKAGVKLLEQFSTKRATTLAQLNRPTDELSLKAYLRLQDAYGEIADLVAELNADLVFEDGRIWERVSVPEWDRYKSDTTLLGPNTRVKIFMKFRTFDGPFVFHCHNLEHEDMRMMYVFDPRPTPDRLVDPGLAVQKQLYHDSEQVVRYRHPWRFDDDEPPKFDRAPHTDKAPPECTKSPRWDEDPPTPLAEPKAHPIWGGWDEHL